MKNNAILYTVLAIVVLFLLGGGFLLLKASASNYQSNDQDKTLSQDQTQLSPPDNTELAIPSPVASLRPSSSPMEGAIKEITVSGFDYGFNPSTITVNQGDHVKINFQNTDGRHNFVIDQLNVETPVLREGNNASVEFVATRPGTYQYYCSVGDHAAMGMVGTLTVK